MFHIYMYVVIFLLSCSSEFCVSDLAEKQFNKAVSRLNQNVLYLCFSQGVNPDNLEPKHTLHNIVALLTSRQLGRYGYSFKMCVSNF